MDGRGRGRDGCAGRDVEDGYLRFSALEKDQGGQISTLRPFLQVMPVVAWSSIRAATAASLK